MPTSGSRRPISPHGSRPEARRGDRMPLVAPAPIESERLLIRLASEDDLPALLDVNSDPEVTALLPYATWSSLGDAEAWYRRMQDLQSTGTALQFAIVAKAERRAIGTSLLFRFEAGS